MSTPAAHLLRPSPGLRGAAPLPAGPLGRPSDSSGRPSGSSIASADPPGRPSRPPVASASPSGRPASPSGRPASPPGRRDRSSVASAKSPVAWRGGAPEAPARSPLLTLRGVAGGPPPASAMCGPERRCVECACDPRRLPNPARHARQTCRWRFGVRPRSEQGTCAAAPFTCR